MTALLDHPPASDADLSASDERTLTDLVLLAVDGIPGCDAAGISLLQDGDVATVAATSEDALSVDHAQYSLGDGPCLTAIRRASAVRVLDFSTDDRWSSVADEAGRVGLRSSLSLPLFEGGAVVGGLNLYSHAAEAFDASSQRAGEAIGRQTAIALRYLGELRHERAARAAEHRIAETLQLSLLPRLHNLPGITCAARYVVGSPDAQVGGDWYDAFALPGGAIGIAIGDVMGHDVVAAAAMGQLRSVLRCYAYEGSTPSVVLDRMDRLVQGFDMAQLATAVYARLVIDNAGGLLMFSNAGHLPPLVRLPDGTVRSLSGAPSPVIGAPMDSIDPRSEAAVALPPGSVLVLYTDGLVESRRLDVEEGIAHLSSVLAASPNSADPDALVEELIAALVGDESEDDVALLIIRIDERTRA